MSEEQVDHRAHVVRLALFMMAMGLTIYGSFRVVQSVWLALFGMAWILVGCVGTLVSLVLLCRSPAPRRRIYLLLFANFPVALICMLSAVDVMTRAEVYVQNDSRATLTEVRLVLRYLDQTEEVFELNDLPPGRRAARALRPRDHGELWLEYRRDGMPDQLCASDYLTGSGGGDWMEIHLGPGAGASINRTRPTFLWPTLP